MDERSHHGQQQYPQYQQPSASPWPSYDAPASHAPIAGHVPHAPQQQPSQQFQYAASGFVLPGAPQGHAPMSAHGGTIGQAQQPAAPTGALPMLHGGAAAQADPYAQPQAWAFPTPNGLQLVPAGAPQQHVQHQQLQHAQAAPMAHYAPAPMPTAAPAPRPAARRMRWETIIPAAAVACLAAAIALFITDFDRITGRESAPRTEQASTSTAADVDTKADTDTGAAPSTDPGATSDVDALAEARKLFAQGHFDEAANLVHPLLEGATPAAAAVALDAKIDAASARNTALLTRLAHQRRAHQWTGVVATINSLAKLRPLSKDLVQLRARAKQAAAAAARSRTASPSRSAGHSTSGGGGGKQPPAAGGTGHASTHVTPPSSVPDASIPPRPDVKNPVSTGGGVSGCVENMPGMDMCPG